MTNHSKLLHCLVFETVHNLAHPGVKPTQKLIMQRFVWHGMKKDITAWVRSCTSCQLAKFHGHTIASFHKFTLPKSRFDCIHVDIVGPLHQSHGHNYLFTIIDRFTTGPKPFQWSISLQNLAPGTSFQLALTLLSSKKHNIRQRTTVCVRPLVTTFGND